MSKHLTQFKNQHLKSDDHIIANIKANAGKAMGRGQNKQINNGELILTNNELVFYKKGLTSETKNSIPLKNISSVSTNSSMLAFNFVISSSGNDFHFNSTDKKSASNFESKLNSALNGTSESVAGSSHQAPQKKGNKLKYGLAIFVVLMIISALFDEPETTTNKDNLLESTQSKDSSEKYLTANDCVLASAMLSETAPLLNKATELYNKNVDSKTFAQWRSKEFNSKIDAIIQKNELPPRAFTDPDLDLDVTRSIYNDVMMRARIYISAIYSYTQDHKKQPDVESQISFINQSVKIFNDKCSSK